MQRSGPCSWRRRVVLNPSATVSPNRLSFSCPAQCCHCTRGLSKFEAVRKEGTTRTSARTCGPYTLASCAHHVAPSAEYPACPSSEYSTTSLSSCSEWSHPRAYSDDNQNARASYRLSTVEGIQKDMIYTVQ